MFKIAFAILIGHLLLFSCVSDDINKVNCDTSTLEIIKTVINTTTCSSADGAITVSAKGGKPPYLFSIDGVTFSSSVIFNNLISGNYTISVKDANTCEKKVEVSVGGSTISASVIVVNGSGCNTSNGEISVTASGGTEPYTYTLGSEVFVSENTFSSLAKGNYEVTVKDANNCLYIVSDVNVSTGISYAIDIKPILEANCIKSGCHNGDNGAERNWSKFENVKAKASGIKTRTGNKTMPQDIAPNGLPQNQIDLIACWVDDGALEN